jgi:hypothetical protein
MSADPAAVDPRWSAPLARHFAWLREEGNRLIAERNQGRPYTAITLDSLQRMQEHTEEMGRFIEALGRGE